MSIFAASSTAPSDCTRAAPAASCLPSVPKHEIATRTSGSDGSRAQSISSGRAPQLATSAASSALCVAIPARHHTAAAFTDESASSRRSHSAGSALASTAACAASAAPGLRTQPWSRNIAVLRSAGDAAAAIVLTTSSISAGDATFARSASDIRQRRPIATIELCRTDGARSSARPATLAASVSERSSASSTFSGPSTSYEPPGTFEERPCRSGGIASSPRSCAKSRRAAWNASKQGSTASRPAARGLSARIDMARKKEVRGAAEEER